MDHLRHWRLGGFVVRVVFGALMDIIRIGLSAFMLLNGVVWVSLLRMCRTEVRGAKLHGRKATVFRLHGGPPPFNQGKS